MKAGCRALHRKWQKDRKPDSLVAYQRLIRSYKESITSAKKGYFQSQIHKAKNSTKALFETTRFLLTPPLPEPSAHKDPAHFCNTMANFFSTKISSLKSVLDLSLPSLELSEALTTIYNLNTKSSAPRNISPIPPESPRKVGFPDTIPAAPAQTNTVFSHFQPVSEAEIAAIIKKLGPSSSPLDPIPTGSIKTIAQYLIPDITRIVNQSLLSGTVPSAWKTGIITPLLKKTNADPLILKNFRPVTQLRLLPRITEYIVTHQFQQHLEGCAILHDHQSGFRPGRGTELAMADVREQLLWLADKNHPAMLVLLDLSAAFDTVDHRLLLKRVEEVGGITGTALAWLGSFLEDRWQRVRTESTLSNPTPLDCGVPQGSALSPLLFNLYMRPLASLLDACGLRFHMYADDTQVIADLHETAGERERVAPCLTLIKEWMRQNRLCLNEDKTEILLVGAAGGDAPLNIPWPVSWGEHPPPSTQVRDLGVMVSQHLDGSAQANSMSRACHHQLNGLTGLFPLLTQEQKLATYHALVGSRLSYGLDFLLSATRKSIFKVQKAQNRALRMILGLPRREHLSAWRHSLKWLSVASLIKYRTCQRIWRINHQLGPEYTKSWVGRQTTLRARRRPYHHLLPRPKFSKIRKGGSTILNKGTKWWNDLPPQIQGLTSFPLFKKACKVHLLEQDLISARATPLTDPAQFNHHRKEVGGSGLDTIKSQPVSGPSTILQVLPRPPAQDPPRPAQTWGLSSPPLPARDNPQLLEMAYRNKGRNLLTGTYQPRRALS